MSVVTIHQAKTHLSRLIQRALEGEDIVIAKRDEPLVRLQVIRETPPPVALEACAMWSLSLETGSTRSFLIF